MHARFWFYLASLILISGLSGWYVINKRVLEAELKRIDEAGLSVDREGLGRYLADQEDGLKLVGLAKLIANNRPELIEPVALRAFELEPNRRDVAVLASPYSEVAKERVKFLDPLF